ncbi:jg5610, partial [Pararge aegeria aegeria]
EDNFQKPANWGNEPRAPVPSRQRPAQATPVMDTVLYKANGNGDRNVQASSRGFTDRSSDKIKEYRKRDAIVNATSPRETDGLGDSIHESAPGNKDGYNRDSYSKFERHEAPARIGEFGEGPQGWNRPYALFYRGPGLPAREPGRASHVAINTGRKAPRTIGALAATDQFATL